MGFLDTLLNIPPCPPDRRAEARRLLDELAQIGRSDDFLSERPGGRFNAQCRHVRAREIGKRLDEIGGLPLMDYAHRRLRRVLGKELASHLEYAWAEIGRWMP